MRRRFGGEVFIGADSPAAGAMRERVRSAGGRAGMRRKPSRGGYSALHRLLHASVMSATRAHMLPQQRLLLAKGTFIDCTLETAIDSTLPGMTTCITATDTFSADGTVVLLPRGTQLMGQTRGRVRQGMARVFVIWTEARTPSGVVVTLNSPSTDALGRSGLSGKVDRHFWERFGAALLVSTLTGVVQSRVESASGTVIVDPTAGEEVLAQTLRANEDIAPTITVPNGKRIEVLVARDIDFRPVYALVER
jgi:type IV secretion system protein VirB10